MQVSGLLLAAAASATLAGLALAQEGRKGTRNYAPAGAAASITEEPVARVNTLEGCIDAWDASTHISREEWREICRRELRAREAHSGPARTP